MSLLDFNAPKRRKTEPSIATPAPGVSEETMQQVHTYRQWWFDTANGEARFRVETEDPVRGPQFTEPYFRVRLATEDDAESKTFAEVVSTLYFYGVGGILCREDWDVTQTENMDCLWLSFGDLVDYRLNEVLVDREPATLGWGPPADVTQVRLESPDFRILLPYQRLILTKALQQLRLAEPGVVLVTDHNGTRSLVFNLHTGNQDHDTAMLMSGVINFFLPRYYHQSVFNNDYDIAEYPLQPVLITDEAELRERLWIMDQQVLLEGLVATEPEPFDPDTVTDARKEAWRAQALAPDARLVLLDSRLHADTRGMAYRLVRPATSGEEGYPFHAIALNLTESLLGAILFDGVGDWDDTDPDFLILSLGDLTHLLITGRLDSNTRDTALWLPAQEYTTGRIAEADVRIVPPPNRAAICQYMERAGVAEPKMALQTLPDKRQLLLFSGKSEAEDEEEMMAQIRCCLPPAYTIYLPDDTRYVAWSVLPRDDTPQKQVFDLDTERTS